MSGAVKLPAGLRGRYVPQKVLGRGSMGQVLLARDTELGRPVAIKLFQPKQATPSLLARFEREARVTSRIDHPHVVRLYDYGFPSDGPAFILYEYVAGVDLSQALIHRGSPFPAEDVLDWGVGLADALVTAHAEGVVHRDVKPANVILREDGTPVLCDFGLARLTSGGGRQTTRGKVVGTLAYMDPSALVLGTVADPLSDQWSLAATLYTALTGAGPITDENFAEVLATAGECIQVELPEAVEAEAPGLTSLMRRALDPAPAARFEDMRAFRDALGFLRGRSSRPPAEEGRSGATVVRLQPRKGSAPPKRPSVELPRPSRNTGVRPVGPRASQAVPKARPRSLQTPAVVALLASLVGVGLVTGEDPPPDPRPASVRRIVSLDPMDDADVRDATRRLDEAWANLDHWHTDPNCRADLRDFVALPEQFEHVRRMLPSFSDGQMAVDWEDFATAVIRWVRLLQRWESRHERPGASLDHPEVARRLRDLTQPQGWRLHKDLRDVDTALLLNFTGVVPDHALLRYRANAQDAFGELKVQLYPLVNALFDWPGGRARLLETVGAWANLVNAPRLPEVQVALLEAAARPEVTSGRRRRLLQLAMFPIASAFMEGQARCDVSRGNLARAEAQLGPAGCSSLYLDCPEVASLYHLAIMRASLRCDGMTEDLERGLQRVERSLAEAGATPSSLARVWVVSQRVLVALSRPPERVARHIERLGRRFEDPTPTP